MADQDPTDRGPRVPRYPADEDAATARAVLGFVLHQHPDQLTDAEVLLALCPEAEGFADRDDHERALHELVGAGLLRRHGDAVLPTRAALCFQRLEER